MKEGGLRGTWRRPALASVETRKNAEELTVGWLSGVAGPGRVWHQAAVRGGFLQQYSHSGFKLIKWVV